MSSRLASSGSRSSSFRTSSFPVPSSQLGQRFVDRVRRARTRSNVLLHEHPPVHTRRALRGSPALRSLPADSPPCTMATSTQHGSERSPRMILIVSIQSCGHSRAPACGRLGHMTPQRFYETLRSAVGIVNASIWSPRETRLGSSSTRGSSRVSCRALKRRRPSIRVGLFRTGSGGASGRCRGRTSGDAGKWSTSGSVSECRTKQPYWPRERFSGLLKLLNHIDAML